MPYYNKLIWWKSVLKKYKKWKINTKFLQLFCSFMLFFFFFLDSVYEKLKLKIFIFIITCSNRLMYDELVLNQICSNKFFFFSFQQFSLWLDFKDRHRKNVIKKFYHLFFGKNFSCLMNDKNYFFEFLLILFWRGNLFVFGG